VWAIAVLLAVLSGDAPALTSEERIEQARQTALTDDYQPTLPNYDKHEGSGAQVEDGSGSKPRERDPWHGQDPDEDYYRRGHHTSERDTGAVGSVLQFLLWAVLIVALAIGVFWFGREILGDKDDAKLDDAEAKPTPEVAAAIVERPLGDADEWARAGNYTEAIHTLLLRTLQELVRASAIRVAPASTSREILARVPLLADARVALAGLITAVEITHFGNDVATADDYARCREQFNVFATAFRKGAAA
jgi:hypothetical protein